MITLPITNDTNNEKKDTSLEENIVHYNQAKELYGANTRFLTHYDEKSQYLLTITSLNIAIFTIIFPSLVQRKISIFTFTFNHIQYNISPILLSGLFLLIYLVLMLASVWYIFNSLRPHTSTLKPHTKEKPGLTYFMDVVNTWREDEFVEIMICERDPYSYEKKRTSLNTIRKALTEDYLRDYYALSLILQNKVKSTKKAYQIVLFSTIYTITIFLAYFYYVGSIIQ